MSNTKNNPVSCHTVYTAYVQAAKDGKTINELADSLGMAKGTLTAALTKIRNGLAEKGLSDEQILEKMPKLKRVTGPRSGSFKGLLEEIVANS